MASRNRQHPPPWLSTQASITKPIPIARNRKATKHEPPPSTSPRHRQMKGGR
jgi:hypothetical protein